jgi:UDP-N-acetylglucosamine diphosphorylase/glucosamine-1-phosphate N-acetyltransferase
MHVVIFEGADWKTLAPLSLSRPSFMLACGAGTLLDKQLRFLRPTRLTLWVRPQLADYCRRHIAPAVAGRTLSGIVRVNERLDAEPALLVSGSTICLTTPVGVADAAVIAPDLCADDALMNSSRWSEVAQPSRLAITGKPAKYIWDLLAANDEALRVDAGSLLRQSATVDRQTWLSDGPFHLINKDEVIVEPGTKLGPGCVIDASSGPIILSSGCIIGANAVVQGPCFIGANAEITPLALIRPGMSIGPSCKIGGEASRSIVVGFSNKAHDGYLGDSYLGEWVNLGAGTITSNLKNTYTSIGMHCGGKEIDTGRRFLGSIIGDHTKTAIGTRFMSGSYVGYCSMIATSAHAPRFTPSFSFMTDKGRENYRLEKAFEVAKAVFARRNRSFTDDDEVLMRCAAAAAKETE